jgi:GT2 family glycosyltransferase
MTLECLTSVFEQTKRTPFEVIVWDNASSDGSAEAISVMFDGRVRLVNSDINLGFAAANNRAAELASGDRLLLLNPDTVVLDEAIDHLAAFADEFSFCGIWGGRTLSKDLSLDPSSCWGRQTLWSLFCQATGLSVIFERTNIFNPEGMGGWNREGIREVDIVCGCFLLIRRDLWVTLGGFQEEFFMYGEEADLCLRAKNIGARPMITSEATIIHYGGASERVFADKLVRLLKAKGLLIDMHFPSGLRQIGRWLLFLWPVRRYCIHAVLAALGRRASVEARDAWREAVCRYREW